jgi:type II secretory pathway pseudopilin PulG
MKVKIKKIGLTLVELLIVMTIIVILASMILIATHGSWINADARQTEGTISLIKAALDDYREFEGFFPNRYLAADFNTVNTAYPVQMAHSASLYVVLNSVPDSRKILERLSDKQLSEVTIGNQTYFVFIDAWKTPLNYLYVNGMNFPQIISAGPDKIFNTADDISNKK